MELDKAFSESVDNIMNFAEILYKCTLCTTLPSILTSKTSFVSHVKGQHFNRNHTRCPECSLTFETEEDLHAHSRLSHCVEITIKKEENPDLKVIREEEITSVEESLSLSSPTREIEPEKGENSVRMNYSRCGQYIPTGKPGISNTEMNCSADKQFPVKPDSQGVSEVMEHSWPENRPTVNIEYGLENPIRQHSCVNNLTKIHAVADQILAVNSTRPKPVGNNTIISPGYTPEFGKFTKLVREGGNIVYFCQVCNWKSQIKSHFQIHCQGNAHIEKLKCAEHDEKSPSPTPRREHIKEIQCDSKRESPMNLSADIGNSSSKIGSPLRLVSGRNKLEHQNKRKRSVPISLRNQSSDRDGWQSSDSDSDSSDFNRTRPYYSGRTPSKKKYSKENKASPDSEMNSKVDNSYMPVLHGNSDSDNTHLHISHAPMKPHSSMSQLSKDYSEENPAKFPFGLYNQIHNQILWNLSSKPSETGRNTPDSQQSAIDSLSYSDRNSSLSTQLPLLRGSPFYPDLVKSDSDYMYRCSLCSFGCNRIQEYRAHFEFQHEQGNSVNEQGPLYGNEGKELWKVNKIKEYLSELICPFPKGNVSRDLLLQKISSSAQLPEAIHWGPACNRAVREIFPDTLAQRKGKFKKTYFFGVSFIEQVQEPTDDLSDPELMQYQPLRDMSQDLEKILEHLHNLVEFSDDLECSISRDDLLTVLHKRIDEPDVLYWGMQCNRAIRIVFPSVIIKRKGKFKTTVYQGVDFKADVRAELQQIPLSMPSKRGRPRKISTDDSSELYQMGMNWTDAIRTGHSETYKMFTNIHIPRPFNSDQPPVTRGWGPLITYHDTDDPQKQTRASNSTFQPQDSGILNSHSESELKINKPQTSLFNSLSMKDFNMQMLNGVRSKSVVHCNIEDSCTERNQIYGSENEAERVSGLMKHKCTPNQNEDDQSDDDQNENTDEDADDEESIGPSIEDKDID